MNIVRATNTTVVDFIKSSPQYKDFKDVVFDEGMQNYIREAIVNLPAHTMVLVAYEDEKLLGFIGAFCSIDSNNQHVYVGCAWVDPTGPKDVMRKLFGRIVMWTENIGYRHIRMETRRSPEAFFRKWGFQTYSTIMQYVIPDDFEETVLKAVKEGQTNGQEVRTESPASVTVPDSIQESVEISGDAAQHSV